MSGDTKETEVGAKETKRGRVRRLLLDPLGFRFPRGTDAEHQKKTLNRIADELFYLTDDSLAALLAMMKSKGEGTSRCFWPPVASFIGFAEVVQRRPMEDLPALQSWFGSIEGPKAEAEGTLVETYQFIAARKIPPIGDGPRSQVLRKAAENQHRLTMVKERIEAGMSNREDDLAFMRWYVEMTEKCRTIMRKARAAKGHAA